MVMIRGYIRVSTKGQAKDGNSLDAQKQTLEQHGAERLYIDAFTGTKVDRPQFSQLIEDLQPGDTLIVTKLDRFARTVSQASELITRLIDKGVTVNVLNVGVLGNDSMSTLLRNVLLAFAQFERDMIVERTQEGKAIAKAKAVERGETFREGRPQKYSKAQIDNAMNLLNDHSYSKVTEITGISKSTLIRLHKQQLAHSKA